MNHNLDVAVCVSVHADDVEKCLNSTFLVISCCILLAIEESIRYTQEKCVRKMKQMDIEEFYLIKFYVRLRDNVTEKIITFNVIIFYPEHEF